MKVRVGVDASIDNVFLEDFTKEVQLVRIPEEPDREIEIEVGIGDGEMERCAASGGI